MADGAPSTDADVTTAKASPGRGRYQRFRRGLAERRLLGLNRREKAAVALLIAATAIAVLLSALMIFGKSGVDWGSDTTWHGVNGVVILAGLVTATALLASAWRPGRTSGVASRVRTVTAVTLPYLGLVALCATVLLFNPTSPDPVSTTVVATVVWMCAAAGCVLVIRTTTPTNALLDSDRAVKIVVPAALLLLLAASAAGVTRSATEVGAVFQPTFALVGLGGLAVLPALSTAGAAKGLEKLHDRGALLGTKVRARPWLLVAGGLAKLSVIVGLWLEYRRRGKLETALDPSWPAWVAGTVLALVVLTLFAVNRRLTFSDSDHLSVSRAAGLLVGGFVGILVVLGLVIGLTLALGSQGLAVLALAIVIAAAVAAARITGRRWRIFAAATIVAFAALCPLWLPERHSGEAGPALVDPPVPAAPPIGTDVAQSILWWVLGAAVTAAIVAALWKKRTSWLVYLAVVAVWVLGRHVVAGQLAPEMTMLNVDLPLTVLLTAAAGVWALGRRSTVDPFEIAATMTITFFLVELPLLGALLPNPPLVKLWLTVLALVTAAVGAVWGSTATLSKPAEQRDGFVSLCTSTLLLYLLLALAWTQADGAATAVVDGIAGLVVGYLSIPVVLLLVAATAVEPAKEDGPTR